MVVDGLLVASAAILMLDSRLRSALAAYVVFTGTTLWLSFTAESAVGIGIFAALAAIKLLIGPLAILWLVRRYRLPEYLAPSLPAVWRVALAAVAIVAGHAAGRMPAFAGIALAGTVFTALFASVATVALHRNLLAHIIGLLVLGSAITLAGAVFARGLPGAVELADTFDAVIATFVALAIARSLVAYDPLLDVRSLRSLRG